MKYYYLLFAFCFSTLISFSCGCTFPGSTKEEFNESEIVFEGKIIQVVTKLKNGQTSKTKKWIVITAFKGVNIGDTLELSAYKSNCSYRIKRVNSKHIIYGSLGEGNKCLTSVCTRNQRRKKFNLNKEYKKEKVKLKLLVTQK